MAVNATAPLGVPLPLCGMTLAVKVTDWPEVDGFWLEVRLVAVGSAATTWDNGELALDA